MVDSVSGQEGLPAEAPVSRRRLFGVLSKTFCGVIAAGALTGPLAMAVDPWFRKRPASSDGNWFSLGLPAQFQIGSGPTRVILRKDLRDAWQLSPNVAVGSVLIERTSQDDFRIFSAICPHLGCSVKPKGKGYLCPCHNSVFDLAGGLESPSAGGSNPSPRGLDTLEWRLDGGQLEVKWARFKLGARTKIPLA